ncbi:hypothetical protein I546_3866 [Mycobacterium kansasii 732]|nr:hypothetical protein I546_3866 [Mycobacterium kansasii 732]
MYWADRLGICLWTLDFVGDLAALTVPVTSGAQARRVTFRARY